MNVLDANNYTLTYSNTTMKVSIGGTGAFSLNFATSPYTGSTVHKELGFSFADTSSATSQTSTNAISLERPTELLLEVREFGSNWHIGARTSRIQTSFYVPLTESQGFLCWFNNDTFDQELYFEKGQKSFGSLSFCLFNKSGSVVSINGIDWSIVLEFVLYKHGFFTRPILDVDH